MRSRPARHDDRWTRSALVLCAGLLVAGCSSGTGRDGGNGPDGDARRVAVASDVEASVETEEVRSSGDAADDPAVWVHPDDPSESAVVATDKKGGLLVYDLRGRELQYLPVGDVNNVDVRSAADGFTLDGRPVALVVTGNRSTNTVDVFQMDAGTRTLRDVSGASIRPDLEVYGSCLYRSSTGSLYAFVTSKGGEVEQWELADDGSGRVVGEKVRAFRLASQIEACVADDELGHLYVGEESAGIWKFGADPGDDDSGTLIAEASESGPLVGDVEGLALAYGPDGTGFLFASSQGDDSYAVFRREGGNDFVGSFRITTGDGIDGTEDTDGIDVVSAPLGRSFPSGVFVAQDGGNDDGNQNFKLVRLDQILVR